MKTSRAGLWIVSGLVLLASSAVAPRALAGKKEMLSFGLDLSQSAVKRLSDGFVGGLPYLVLALVVAHGVHHRQVDLPALEPWRRLQVGRASTLHSLLGARPHAGFTL